MKSGIVGAQDVPASLRKPLSDLLIALGDDELVLGYWTSEWTGVAPLLEEDVACSSIAQDEIGHARLYYEEAAQLTGLTVDRLVYGRQPQEYRHVQLVEHRRGDWAFTIARQFLYELADQQRLAVLQNSTYLPLAQAAQKIMREEGYHLMHVQAWFERLAQDTAAGRKRLEIALDYLWPDALGMFEAYPDEAQLLQSGVLTSSSQGMGNKWLEEVVRACDQLQLAVPVARSQPDQLAQQGEAAISIRPTIEARIGGRQGQHTQDFQALWEQMTMVYRLEPQAQW